MDGLRLSAQVSDFVAGRRLAWSGQGIDISTYHAWVISGDLSGSRALAGFAARGAAAIALRETDPGAAQRTLDRWAADLKAAAEARRVRNELSAVPSASRRAARVVMPSLGKIW